MDDDKIISEVGNLSMDGALSGPFSKTNSNIFVFLILIHEPSINHLLVDDIALVNGYQDLIPSNPLVHNVSQSTRF